MNNYMYSEKPLAPEKWPFKRGVGVRDRGRNQFTYV